jgi:hypothetical protein
LRLRVGFMTVSSRAGAGTIEDFPARRRWVGVATIAAGAVIFAAAFCRSA